MEQVTRESPYARDARLKAFHASRCSERRCFVTGQAPISMPTLPRLRHGSIASLEAGDHRTVHQGCRDRHLSRWRRPGRMTIRWRIRPHLGSRSWIIKMSQSWIIKMSQSRWNPHIHQSRNMPHRKQRPHHKAIRPTILRFFHCLLRHHG